MTKTLAYDHDAEDRNSGLFAITFAFSLLAAGLFLNAQHIASLYL